MKDKERRIYPMYPKTDLSAYRYHLIGLVDGIKDPAKVERALWKIVPPQEGNDLCHRFVLHGRAVCVARRPRCGECCLKEICRHAKSQGLSRGESEQQQDIRPDR